LKLRELPWRRPAVSQSWFAKPKSNRNKKDRSSRELHRKKLNVWQPRKRRESNKKDSLKKKQTALKLKELLKRSRRKLIVLQLKRQKLRLKLPELKRKE